MSTTDFSGRLLAWAQGLPLHTKMLLTLATSVLLVELAFRRFAPRSAAYRKWTAAFVVIGSVWTAIILSIVYFTFGVARGDRHEAAAARIPWTAGWTRSRRFWRIHEPNPLGPRRGPPPVLMPTHVLGLSCFYHDSAAALLRDGEVVAACQEERLSRKRHDSGFPSRAVKYVLKEAGIGPEQLDAVGFYDKPLLKFERMLSTYVATFPRSFNSFRKAMPLWIHEKLWMPSLIRKELRPYKGPILFAEHHMSHAASAFLVSPFEEAAILTVDGVGEWATASFGVGRGTDITLFKEIRFPHSPGPALQRVHLLPRVQGQQRRVQGDGAGALREARALRPDHERHGPPERGRLVQART